MMQFPTPAAPPVIARQDPALPQVVLTPAPLSPMATSSEVYQAMRAQRRVLGDQLDELVDARQDIVGELRQGAVSEADRAGLEQRLVQVDQRIASVSDQIASADAQVAQAAAVPGATIQPPEPPAWVNGPPEELVAMGIFFTALLISPLVIAWSRRIWRRSAVTIPLPPELGDRLGAMERSMDAVAIEVERIGEGQRFVTQLLAGRAGAAPAPLAAGERASDPRSRPGS